MEPGGEEGGGGVRPEVAEETPAPEEKPPQAEVAEPGPASAHAEPEEASAEPGPQATVEGSASSPPREEARCTTVPVSSSPQREREPEQAGQTERRVSVGVRSEPNLPSGTSLASVGKTDLLREEASEDVSAVGSRDLSSRKGLLRVSHHSVAHSSFDGNHTGSWKGDGSMDAALLGEAEPDEWEYSQHGEQSSGTFSALANLTNCILDAGILGVPYVMGQAGFIGGFVIIIAAAIVSCFTLELLIYTSDRACRSGLIASVAYDEVGEVAFGLWGRNAVLVIQLIYCIGALVGYVVVVRDNFMTALSGLLGHNAGQWVRDMGKVGFGAAACVIILLPICLKRDVSSIGHISALTPTVVVAIIGIFTYEVSAKLDELCEGQDPPCNREYTSVFTSDAPAMTGLCIFAFLCHHNSFQIYRSLGEGAEPSKFRWVARGSIAFAAIASMAMGVVVYATFGTATKDDIFENYPESSSAVNAARMLMAINMLLSFPMNFLASREVLEVLVTDSPSERKEQAGDLKPLEKMPPEGSVYGGDDGASTVRLPPFTLPGEDASGHATHGSVRLRGLNSPAPSMGVLHSVHSIVPREEPSPCSEQPKASKDHAVVVPNGVSVGGGSPFREEPADSSDRIHLLHGIREEPGLESPSGKGTTRRSMMRHSFRSAGFSYRSRGARSPAPTIDRSTIRAGSEWGRQSWAMFSATGIPQSRVWSNIDRPAQSEAASAAGGGVRTEVNKRLHYWTTGVLFVLTIVGGLFAPGLGSTLTLVGGVAGSFLAFVIPGAIALRLEEVPYGGRVACWGVVIFGCGAAILTIVTTALGQG
eukprot:Hpha_TRINITY_DN3413_c0_g1::TRINITY_DN3413_c0_g1_i1::g.32586::m.32586/K14997/SLC38A11; solute carrier family 38 (sodium-coupled neutral amino acid transporter), member 11